MLDKKVIKEMAEQISSQLPPALKDVAHEVESIAKQVLQSGFTKLDLVQREEFDVQTEVLIKTRNKLEMLENRISDLEEKLGAKTTIDDKD